MLVVYISKNRRSRHVRTVGATVEALEPSLAKLRANHQDAVQAKALEGVSFVEMIAGSVYGPIGRLRSEKWIEAERLQMKMLLELGLVPVSGKKDQGSYQRIVMVPWNTIDAEVASLQRFGENAVVIDGGCTSAAAGATAEDLKAVELWAKGGQQTIVVPIGGPGRESKINHGT